VNSRELFVSAFDHWQKIGGHFATGADPAAQGVAGVNGSEVISNRMVALGWHLC
jgi:hypothetical protein